MPDVQLNGIEFSIKGDTAGAVVSIDRLRNALSKLQKINISDLGLKAISGDIRRFARAINTLDTSKIDALAKGLRGITGVGNMFGKMAENPDAYAGAFKTMVGYLTQMSTIDFTNLEVAAQSINQIASSANKIGKQAADGANSTAKGIKFVGQAAKQTQKPLANFIASLKRIAFYRIIRSIIKAITSALQEGLKNAYEFSKMNNNAGGLAYALDSISTAAMTMKNQLGAAFGGLLTALSPIIIQLIRLVTAFASAITRLIAILSGKSTWLQAVDVWTEWGDAAEGAGGAAKEALKYLAPFDELNVLPSDRAGGGGGSNNPNIGNMFQEVSTDVGSGLLDTLSSALDSLADWLINTDWADLADKLWQGLKTAFSDSGKASEVMSSLSHALGAAIGSASAFIGELVINIVGDLFSSFKSYLVDYNGDGKISVVEFLGALFITGAEMYEGLKAWVEDNIINPFLNGFAEAWGLTDGSELKQQIKTWFNNSILSPLVDLWNNFADFVYEKTHGFVDLHIDFQADIVGVDTSGLTTQQKILEGIMRLIKTDKSKLTNDDRTILKGKLNYASVDKTHLTDNDRTIKQGKINYASAIKTNLTDAMKTIQTVAKFGSTDKTNVKNSIIDTIAKFTDYKVASNLIEDSSKPKRITIDTLFNLSKQKNIPTIDVYTNPVNPPTGSGGGGPTFDLRSVSAQAALGISTNVSSEGEEAMYRAMLRALNESDIGNGDVTLDGDVLYRAVVNRNKAMKRAYGVNPMLTT